jgi:DNA-binding MarR family transcriptional regulator
MTDKTIEQHIHVPEGCMALTRILPMKHLTKMPHVRVFIDGLLTLSLDPDLTGQDLRVMMICLAEMEYENFLNKTQRELAEVLGIKQQDVAKSIKKLVEKDYLRIVGHQGRQNLYQISPHIVLKSRAKNLEVLIEAWEDGKPKPEESKAS